VGWIATGLASVAIFAGSCIINYFSINCADLPHLRETIEGLNFLLPVLAFLICYFAFRVSRIAPSFWLAVVATLFAFLLSIPLFLTLGVWFHLGSGGQF